MIEIVNLKKEFPSVVPIKEVNTVINDGDVISVIGPSGTGKSTFLRCINLLEKPTSGKIILDGQDITEKGFDVKEARRKIGMVFQSFNLFSHLTVIENLMIPQMDLMDRNKQEAYEKGIELLKQVGLKEKAFSYPDELSGGQKQRVAIARTLCMDPEVILLDEPTSALDPTMVSEVQSVIKSLSKSGKTMIIVTHEMNFARSISNRVFYMDEGGIYEEGTPEEIFDAPQKELTRRFIKGLKVFETEIDSRDYDFIEMDTNLEMYLIKNDVLSIEKNRIRLAIEEILQQILFPKYKNPYIHIKTEYSAVENQCVVYIDYKGEQFDIRETDNNISLAILENIVTEIVYSFNPSEEVQNHVEMHIVHPGK